MLCRCESHGWPDGDVHTYVAKVKLAGGANEAILCGLCETPGDIYLNDREYYRYEHEGKRLYKLFKQDYFQFRLSDSPVEVKEHLTREEDNPPEEPRNREADSAAETDW